MSQGNPSRLTSFLGTPKLGRDDRIVRLTIPNWLPPSANRFTGRHWSAIDKAKKEVANLLSYYAYLSRAKMVDHIYRPVREVQVVAFWHQHEPDPDNLNKVLRDALKRSRLIVDDSQNWAKFIEPGVHKADRDETWITLIDLELMPAIPVEEDPEYVRFLAKYQRKD